MSESQDIPSHQIPHRHKNKNNFLDYLQDPIQVIARTTTNTILDGLTNEFTIYDK